MCDSDCSVSSDYEDDFTTNVASTSVSSDIEESGAKVGVFSEKSRLQYESAYERFDKWCEDRNMENRTSETVLLTYFEHNLKSYKPSSLWSYYSMLRTIILKKQSVDIGKYKHLNAFLKKKSTGYQAKKSKILTREDVTKFLTEANDDRFLMMKVALIIGVRGGCRREKLTNLLVENVQDEGQFIRVTIPNTRTQAMQEFFITSGDVDGSDMVQIVRNYIALRPAHTPHSRFFVGYRYGKCTKQPVGINTFGTMPKVIASFLKLPNPEEYTGHCFKRSSSLFKR